MGMCKLLDIWYVYNILLTYKNTSVCKAFRIFFFHFGRKGMGFNFFTAFSVPIRYQLELAELQAG